MKTIAQINADEAGELVDFLKNQRFSYSTKSTTDEGGIDVIEFLVDEQDYESVSSAVDEWQAKMWRRRKNSHTVAVPPVIRTTWNTPQWEVMKH